MSDRKKFEMSFIRMRAVHGAIVVASATISGILVFLGQQNNLENGFFKSENIWMVFAIASLSLIFWKVISNRKMHLNQRLRGEEEFEKKFSAFQVQMILIWAMLESATILSAVFCYVFQDLSFLIFAALNLIVLVLNRADLSQFLDVAHSDAE